MIKLKSSDDTGGVATCRSVGFLILSLEFAGDGVGEILAAIGFE